MGVLMFNVSALSNWPSRKPLQGLENLGPWILAVGTRLDSRLRAAKSVNRLFLNPCGWDEQSSAEATARS